MLSYVVDAVAVFVDSGVCDDCISCAAVAASVAVILFLFRGYR